MACNWDLLNQMNVEPELSGLEMDGVAGARRHKAYDKFFHGVVGLAPDIRCPELRTIIDAGGLLPNGARCRGTAAAFGEVGIPPVAAIQQQHACIVRRRVGRRAQSGCAGANDDGVKPIQLVLLGQGTSVCGWPDTPRKRAAVPRAFTQTEWS